MPRDQLDHARDVLHKARRYWRVPVIAVVLGVLAALVFALLRAPVYKSSASIQYQERIQSGVLQGRDTVQTQRNAGERLSEMLRARTQLALIVGDPALNPFPRELIRLGMDAAVEELREVIEFEARGTTTFRIGFRDTDPKRAQAVTARLTELLRKKEEAIRTEQVEATAAFAEAKKAEADAELEARTKRLTEFKTAHPEFAEDAAMGQEGASIRASSRRIVSRATTPRLASLERQAARLTAQLAAPPGARVVEPTDASRQAARAVEDAQRELASAQRELDDAQASFTAQHPDVKKARTRVVNAEARLELAKSQVPEDTLAPASEADRQRLERELAAVRQQLADERKRTPNEPAGITTTGVDAIVALETEFTKLRDAVNEQREVAESLAQSAFRARMESQRQLADAGASLTIVDPAYLPVKPIGTGRRFILIGGVVIAFLIGLGVMLLLALLDDRIYRASDLAQTGMPLVMAEIPTEGT